MCKCGCGKRFHEFRDGLTALIEQALEAAGCVHRLSGALDGIHDLSVQYSPTRVYVECYDCETALTICAEGATIQLSLLED